MAHYYYKMIDLNVMKTGYKTNICSLKGSLLTDLGVFWKLLFEKYGLVFDEDCDEFLLTNSLPKEDPSFLGFNLPSFSLESNFSSRGDIPRFSFRESDELLLFEVHLSSSESKTPLSLTLKKCKVGGIELFNYSFNVFVSIMSGETGRHEVFSMILCYQSQRYNSRFHPNSIRNSLMSSKSDYQRQSINATKETNNSTNRSLLTK